MCLSTKQDDVPLASEIYGPDINPFVSFIFSLNFKEPEAVRALTCTLLKEDFGLTIDIPLERLIPTVPLRLNYIHWVEDLIGCGTNKNKLIRGIDIGMNLQAFLYSFTVQPRITHNYPFEFDPVYFSSIRGSGEHNIKHMKFSELIIELEYTELCNE